jgi:hypothetical protein
LLPAVAVAVLQASLKGSAKDGAQRADSSEELLLLL